MSVIGFVGLGAMGGPMARNLIRAGHQLRLFDLSAENAAAVSEGSAVICTTPQELMDGVEFVVTMLPNGKIVSDLLEGPDGLFAASDRGKAPLFMDCSTIAAETAIKLAISAEEHGVSFVDAPVSGGVERAIAGNLAIMVGGKEAYFRRATPVLEGMSRVIYHVGEAGSGQTTKICNNMLAGVIMAATAEALSLGERLGLDVNRLCEIICQSSGSSFMLEHWNPYPGVVDVAPSSRNYEKGFQLQLMLKDMGLALDGAGSCKHPTPFAALAQNLYVMKLHSEPGAAFQDFSKVLDLFRIGLPGSSVGNQTLKSEQN